MSPRKQTASDSPVAARAALQERENPGGDDNLKQQAKDQEKQQRDELAAGDGGAAGRREVREREKIFNDGKGDAASLRVAAGASQPGAQGGRVDNMSARHDGDALEGHFVRIDLSNKDAREAVQQAAGEDAQLGAYNGDYGVYLEPAATDPDTGYPVTAVVRLRDATNARVVVPYESLSPSEAGHR